MLIGLLLDPVGLNNVYNVHVCVKEYKNNEAVSNEMGVSRCFVIRLGDIAGVVHLFLTNSI